MKKILGLLLIFSLFLGAINAGSASANSEVPPSEKLSDEQLSEMNEVLEELRLEVNKKLAQGEKDVSVKGYVSFQEEPIILNFSTDNAPTTKGISTMASTMSSTMASAEKTYRASVVNKNGLNFAHELAGSFVYSGGKITGHSKNVLLSGIFYSKSHTTRTDKLDPSVFEITSVGSFTAIKYAPIQYTTKIIVRLYGSGTYTLMRAAIG